MTAESIQPFVLKEVPVPVRHPRCWLQINGARIPCLEARATRQARRGADSFSALLSINATARYGMDLAFWTDFEPTEASVIFASMPGGGDAREMVVGMIDEPNVALGQMTVSVSGRDKSASLTEKRRNEKFANQKPSQIVEKIAKEHGLKAVVQGAGAFAGKIYDEETAHLITNRTDFEVLTDLAEQLGYRWFVDGSSLYFEPKGQTSGSFNVHWVPPAPGEPADANVLDISLRRNMNAARPHKVSVRSWHGRSKRLFKSEAKVDGKGQPIEYRHHHNGKNQQQVEALAKSRLKNAIRHELGIVVRAPGDLSVDVRQALSLTGTGTIFDQGYEIDHATWDIGWNAGFTMVLDATAAKQGRDPDGGGGGSGAPLPPRRPSGLTGRNNSAGSGGGPVVA